jgi:hypothetical protein
MDVLSTLAEVATIGSAIGSLTIMVSGLFKKRPANGFSV